jgi:hypothetical protein
MNNSITDMNVLYDFMCSDHRPLSFILKCSTVIPITNCSEALTHPIAMRDWSRVDNCVGNLYANVLDCKLSQITFPDTLRNCCYTKCNDLQHAHVINEYYSNIIDCIKCSIEATIPLKAVHNSEFNVPGWNDYVQDKYDLSREAFLDWVSCGRPRSGAVFSRMSRCRASFKLALRYCRQHVDQMRADACANALDLHDAKRFWSNVNKVNNSKATKYANCVGGTSGDDNIASMWMNHFNILYNSVDDDGSKDEFFARIKSGTVDSFKCAISVNDIIDAVSRQKKGKSAGPDGIHMEAFMFGNK